MLRLSNATFFFCTSVRNNAKEARRRACPCPAHAGHTLSLHIGQCQIEKTSWRDGDMILRLHLISQTVLIRLPMHVGCTFAPWLDEHGGMGHGSWITNHG